MKRPLVIVNCAMSADGKTALPNGKQLRISSEEDIARMYHLRNECDAVLVGVGTILSDNPKLTVKETYVKNPRQPLRVVLDSKGRTPPDALVLSTAANTLILTAKGHERLFEGAHIEVVGCTVDEHGLLKIPDVLRLLYERGVRKLLVEGGGTVIWNFLKNGVVDDLYVYIGPCVVGGSSTPTMASGEGITREEEKIPLTIVETRRVGAGVVIHYQLNPRK